MAVYINILYFFSFLLSRSPKPPPTRTTTMYFILMLLIFTQTAFTLAAEKLAGGASLEDVVPMKKVQRPKLKEPQYVLFVYCIYAVTSM